MPKLPLIRPILITAVTALLTFCLQIISTSSVLSLTPDVSINSPTTIATATTAPSLISAKLFGKPVHVLYMTRAEDTVLVRCYPGYLPFISIQTMGTKPDMEASKEGVLRCKAAA
ncbi:MAG TPA: hypothetical protein V6D19_11900 [Stenomitos sp.]